MKYLPTTVNATLIFSLLVSFVLLPFILSFLPLKVNKVSNSFTKEN
jgi:multidrug efflux pump subunit AcrB